MYASAKRLITLLAVWLLALVSVSLSAALQAPLRQCNLPLGDKPFETATPEEVGLSADEVAAALAYANLHGRFAVHIFRNNCLVGRVDALTDNIPVQIFSVMKSIVGMLAGIAVADGKLDIDRRGLSARGAQLGGCSASRHPGAADPHRDVGHARGHPFRASHGGNRFERRARSPRSTTGRGREEPVSRLLLYVAREGI